MWVEKCLFCNSHNLLTKEKKNRSTHSIVDAAIEITVVLKQLDPHSNNNATNTTLTIPIS